MHTWRDRTVTATTAGFTREDCRDAWGWTTCPVGEQWQRHPEVVRYVQTLFRDSRYGVFYAERTEQAPTDPELQELGGQFYRAVLTMDVALAEQTLDAIEDRVLELKRQAASRGGVA